MKLLEMFERSNPLNVSRMFPKTRIPLPSTQDMDDLKVSTTQLSSTMRVLTQLLVKINKDKKSENLKQAIINADRTFDSTRKLVKQLDKYKSMDSVSKKDFKIKLEDLFRQVFSFLDGTDNYMGKSELDTKGKEKRMLFLAKQEAKKILNGVQLLHAKIKKSGI